MEMIWSTYLKTDQLVSWLSSQVSLQAPKKANFNREEDWGSRLVSLKKLCINIRYSTLPQKNTDEISSYSIT
jgi:hypothetical protein